MLAVRKPQAALVFASALCGAALGFAASAALHGQALEEGPVTHVALRLDGDTRQTASGEVAFARARIGSAEAVVYAVFDDAHPMLQGECVEVSGVLVPADWSKDAYLWQNGAAGRLRVTSCELLPDSSPVSFLHAARRCAIEAIGDDDDAHALTQAIVCGYRHSIAGSALYAGFQACGLAHLVAVSGAHLVIVTGLFASVLRSLRVRRAFSVGLLSAIMAAYLVFSGMPVSAVRAAVMTALGMLCVFGRRRPSAQNALGLGMFAIVATSPSASVSVSFALSALSTAGIVLFSPLFSWWFAHSVLARVPVAADALSLTCSANMLSQLYACSVFGVVPLVGPLANIACAPLFPFACASGLIAAFAACIGFPLADMALSVAVAVAGALGALAGILADLPFSSLPFAIDARCALLVSVGAAAGTWALWSRLRLRCVLAAAVLAIAVLLGMSAVAAQEDAIVMLDVGQGDALLVRSRGQSLLIDTGNRDTQLVLQLARCSVAKLDSVLLTHSDDDHVGALDAIERSVHVDRAIVARGMGQGASEKNKALIEQAKRTARDVVYVSAGDSFRVGAFTMRVVWPRTLSDDGGNADSICLVAEYDGDGDGKVDFRALFTGDAEKEQIQELLDAGAVGDVDVLKVGHHGSRNGMSALQAEALDPEIALVSVGAQNRYGHPAQETIDMLEAVGCRVYRTDLDGQVKCSFTPDAIRVGLQ